jgi:tetratricopeptide (TPR) repeat protein
MGKSNYKKKNPSRKVPATGTASNDKPKREAGASAVNPATASKKGNTIPDNSRKANRYFVLFFFVCAVILYGNTIFNKWAVDDNFVTGPQNELVKKGFSAIPKIFTSFYVDTKGNVGSQQTDYRPIVKMTYAIEYGLWGGNKAGRSHLINILLYFWISTLLFFILKRLLKNYNILFPFLITLLFMAHPVHTEVVASLKNRDELLAFLCGLGGLHFLLKYYEKNRILYVIATLVLFIIGYLAKSSILPFVLLYPLVLYFFTDMKPKKFIWLIGILLVAVMIAYFIPRLFLPKSIHVNSFIENPLFMEKSIWIRTGTGMITLWFYLKLLIFPYPLVYYYGYNMIPITGWGNIFVVISFFIHLGLFSYAVMKFREKHILSFAILYYLLAIAIYTNIVTPVVGIVGERFVFNASLGFIIALVYLIFKVFRTEPRSLTIEFNERAKIIVIVVLILIPCTVMTIKRNREWRNIRDLYFNDIKHLEKSVKANVEYAEFLSGMVYKDPNYQVNGAVNERLQQEIVSHFRTALKMYPNDYTTLNDLGAAYLNFSSKVDSGVVFLRKAIALRPELQSAWVNMSMAYRKRNMLDSAIFCYQKVLSINPGTITAVFKIADLYYEKGELGKAIQINEDVLKAYPDLDIPYFNIGYYFIMQGDTTTAIKYWEQAAKRKPTYEVCTDLSIMYKARGDFDRANYYSGLAADAQQQSGNANNR